MDPIATYNEIKNLNPNALLIDVREPSELKETGVLPNSINIPVALLEDVLKNMSDDDFQAKYGCSKPPIGKEVIFSCKAGGRAHKAMQCALKLGYKNARYYKGSWTEWAEKSKQ